MNETNEWDKEEPEPLKKDKALHIAFLWLFTVLAALYVGMMIT